MPLTSTCLIRGCCLPALCRQWSIRLRPSIAEELPNFSHFLDHLEIQICDNNFIFVAACLRDNFSSRITEITLAIELPDTPWFLGSNAIHCAHEVTIRHCMRRLFQYP